MSKKMMKRSLALGALMAFVITGSAWADIIVDDQNWVVYHQLGGTVDAVDADNVKGSNDRVVGGWSGSFTSNVESEHSTSVTVNGGNWRYIIGGSYLSGVENPQSVNMKLVSSEVIVNKGATSPHIVGGTSGNDINNLVMNNENRIAHLVINSDENYTFGNSSWWNSENCLENLIVGGDHIKNNSSPDADTNPAFNNQCDVKLMSSLTEINGGVYDTLIIGGSLANQYNATIGSGVLKTYVGKAETIITGGVFNKPIVAGGVAKGGEAVSDVGEAILSITNATVNSDVFTAGMVCYGDASGTEGANVKQSTVTIKSSKVNNIYNTRGYFYYDNGWDFWAEDEAPEDSSADSSAEGYLDSSKTKLTLVNATVNKVDITDGSVTLRKETGDKNVVISKLEVGEGVKVSVQTDGATNDTYNGNAVDMYADCFDIDSKYDADGIMEKGKVVGMTTFDVVDGEVVNVVEAPHEGNAGVTHNANIALMAWRAETNDMNKRMGELRNANGEHGVWARMVGGEDEFKDAKYEYTQYQLGYDEKLSVDPSWTVGFALSYTDGESSFTDGSGENTHKGLSVYGSKLNDDGSFIDLIAKYSRLEHDLTLEGDKGDYSTNGYSVSAEYGKRFQQGNGLWIEPQVELTYGKVKSAEYKLGQKTVSQDAMESLVGRVGFSLGKDISKGNVYARASYLYDFEGDTNVTFTNGATRNFAYDLGGGWWEVGVGANINLSKATYIYADVEKAFGGEVDTNWQWNLGVRYSF